MEILESLPKDIQILIIASPVFIGIIVIGLVLHSGYKRISRTARFWLIATCGLTLLYINGLVDGTLSEYRQVKGIFTIAAAFQTYRTLRK